MSSKPINLTLSVELLRVLDQAAVQEYVSRSEYIRQAIIMRLKGQERVDKETDDLLEELRKLSQN